MSQPLWFLRHENRIVGPFPAPQVREFLKTGEITPDWEVSLDEADWLSIRDSGQFEEGHADWTQDKSREGQNWRAEREQARNRWLQEDQTLSKAQVHDLALERRARQAMAEHQAGTDTLIQAERSRKPPIVAGLAALLLLLGGVYFVATGQKDEPAIQAGISLKADCAQAPGEAVNLAGCDKRGLQAPGVVGRNMRLEGVNLDSANLAAADLSYGALARANLRNANLNGAKLVGVDLTGGDLSGADLRNTDLSYAVLKGARLEGTRLEGARLAKAVWITGETCPETALGQCQ
ncbi:MAG: pentapeptide repeat-containing protein [Pseudomonadota bacterium]